MSDNVGKWSWSDHEERWSSGEMFDSREEAIAEGANALDDDKSIFWTGQIAPVELGFDGAALVEQLQEQAYEQVYEVADRFLDDLKPSQIADLEVEVNAVMRRWLARHRLEPSFFKIVDVREHNAPAIRNELAEVERKGSLLALEIEEGKL